MSITLDHVQVRLGEELDTQLLSIKCAKIIVKLSGTRTLYRILKSGLKFRATSICCYKCFVQLCTQFPYLIPFKDLHC